MSEPAYTYRGMMVQYWDLLRGDTSQWSSRPYFLKIIRESGQPALDVAHRALHCFYEHLQPGGTLAMSMRVFKPDPSAEEWELIEEAVRPSDGATVRRWFRCTYDVLNRLQHAQDRYEIVRDGEILETEFHEASPYLTWYLASEALPLVENAGFVEVRAESDFTPEPARDADSSYVVLGRRP